MKSFLMMGQSNMAGRGDFDEVTPIRNPHTFMLRNGLWQPMTEPINCDRPIKRTGKLGTNSGIGPAASFADAYAGFYGEDVGLIPCAEGGSSLDMWRVDGQLFLNAYYQALLAMNSSELTGVIWHQGEAECGTDERADSYAERFLVIMNELQKRLGVTLRIVVGELGDFMVERCQNDRPLRVNAQLHKLAEFDNIAAASAKGLTDRGDILHFNAVSQREFGRRYFEAYRAKFDPAHE